MRTLLITGGAGFIGSCLVRQTLSEDSDARVINLDNLTYAGNLDSLDDVRDDPRHVFVQGDIANRQLIARLLCDHRPAAVIHLAAESHVDRSIDAPRTFAETNVLGTVELLIGVLEYWQTLTGGQRDAFRFLHVSTDEVFGSLGATGKFAETTPYAPNSPYAASKAASDLFVRAFGHTYGLPILLTNCSNNYGPFQFPEKLIPLVTLAAADGRPLPVYGKGDNVRDWLSVEDHCRALRRVLAAGRVGESYNIGGDCERTNLEVVTAICDLVDELCPTASKRPCRELVTFVADRPGHDLRYAIDATKIKKQLGWQPTESFASGLRRTVQWYLDHRDWAQRVTNGKYQGERLGVR